MAASEIVKRFYTDILSQVFSPCGKFLAVVSINGDIHVFDLAIILDPPEDSIKSSLKPILTFPAHPSACVLLSTEKFLIVGAVGKVFGFEWKSIIAGKVPKLSWSWDIPYLKNKFESSEINAMYLGSKDLLYMGCGDGKIHVYSLEDGRYVKSLSGHDGYIHDLFPIDINQLASAGEDGFVRIWDLRSDSWEISIEPWKTPGLQRPRLGKWVGALHYTNDWLLCGGGFKTAMFQLKTLQHLQSFSTEDAEVHTCMTIDDRVLVGESNKVSEFSIQGEHICSISSSSQTIYNMAYQESPHKVLSICGNSPCLDICTNLDYRELVVSCL